MEFLKVKAYEVIGHTMHFKKIQKVTWFGQQCMRGNTEELDIYYYLLIKENNYQNWRCPEHGNKI